MPHPGLLNDILFKIVFGSEDSVPVLRALLNALLNLEGSEKIATLQILNPSISKEYIADKGPLDVKAKDEAGRQYNIEVQLSAGSGDYVSRSLYYATRFFTEQLSKGAPYSSLQKTVTISLLDFILFPDSKELHNRFLLKEAAQGFELTDIIELHYIELRKFLPSKPHQLKTRFEKWLYLLKFSDLFESDKDLPENLAEEEGMTMALESMRKAYAQDEVRQLIESRRKGEHDWASGIEHAHLQGLEQGLEQGQRLASIEVAQRMKQEGLALEQIAKLTGLSVGEVSELG